MLGFEAISIIKGRGSMKIKYFIVALIMFRPFVVFGGDDTIIYSSAATQDGKQNVFIVEQPKDAPNPLGNPIPNPNKPVEVFGNVYNKADDLTQPDTANTTANQQQQNLGNDFENTLLEANDRVYDIQSYPTADFKAMGDSANPKTIYSPNVNN